MFEYAALQDCGLGLLSTTQQRPLRTASEEGLHACRRAPIQVVLGIQPIPESRRNRNDPLVFIVSQCNEDMDRTDRLILRRRGVQAKAKTENRKPGESDLF